MTYATQADLLARYGEAELIQLTDRVDPPAGVIDAAIVATALADADAEIDGYLAGRYALPLAPAPAVLVLAACDIARYRLYGNAPSEEVRQRYEDRIAWLRLVGKGDISLAPDAPAPSGGGVQFTSSDRVFGRDTLNDY